MTPEKPPPGTIPTLTEVVPWPGGPPPAPTSSAPPAIAPAIAPPTAPPTAPPVPASPELVAGAPALPAPASTVAPVQAPAGGDSVTEAQLARRVMADLQKQVDLMLEVRLREALAPILARAGDAIVRDARKELTTALSDVVARAVAKELGPTDKR